jgi:hypothetical protein
MALVNLSGPELMGAKKRAPSKRRHITRAQVSSAVRSAALFPIAPISPFFPIPSFMQKRIKRIFTIPKKRRKRAPARPAYGPAPAPAAMAPAPAAMAPAPEVTAAEARAMFPAPSAAPEEREAMPQEQTEAQAPEPSETESPEPVEVTEAEPVEENVPEGETVDGYLMGADTVAQKKSLTYYLKETAKAPIKGLSYAISTPIKAIVSSVTEPLHKDVLKPVAAPLTIALAIAILGGGAYLYLSQKKAGRI